MKELKAKSLKVKVPVKFKAYDFLQELIAFAES